jgi:hypothetical protein
VTSPFEIIVWAELSVDRKVPGTTVTRPVAESRRTTRPLPNPTIAQPDALGNTLAGTVATVTANPARSAPDDRVLGDPVGRVAAVPPAVVLGGDDVLAPVVGAWVVPTGVVGTGVVGAEEE